MQVFRLLRKSVFAFLVVAGLLGVILGGVWVLRAPVVVVTDRGFDMLYGKSRADVAKVTLFLRCFRSFRTAVVADQASPDSAAEAAFRISRKPWLVVFPFRYAPGARLYRERHPGNPCLVIGQDVVVDSAVNLYRAGRLAGRACARGGFPAIIPGANADVASLASFKAGLTGSGCLTEPVVLGAGEKPEAGKLPGVLVVASPGAAPIPSEWRKAPLILFSWISPDFAGNGLLAIFDDSPWALLPEIMDNQRKKKPQTIASQVHLGEKSGQLFPKRAQIQAILEESPKKE